MENIDREIADRIKKEFEELIVNKYPEWGFMMTAEKDKTQEFMIVGNMCVVCSVKEILMQIMQGKIVHLDGHEAMDMHIIPVPIDKEVKH